jgi:hypothetical protein
MNANHPGGRTLFREDHHSAALAQSDWNQSASIDSHGAFSTYTQAGQDYGTTLLWTLLLLVPVLYVNQEMVLRLGVGTGVARRKATR